MDNPEYLEITKRTRILKHEEIISMSISESVLQRRKELIQLFLETEEYTHNILVDQKKI